MSLTTEEVLRFHAQKFPCMRPTDAVKLLYQNEFGGGHLIEDPQRSLGWLVRECAAVVHDAAAEKTTPIGNGIVRVNLAALNTDVLPLEKLNEIFVRSSALVHGQLAVFQEKLTLLTDLTAQGAFGFSSAELEEYLAAYMKLGYPPVSHSQEFRDAYRPAYRVVLERLL